MWWFLSQNVLLSICIILIFQYIWDYCKTNYTTRKTKNVIDIQTQKYRDIIDEMNRKPSTESLDYLSEKDKQEMIHDLTKFLHENN